MREVVIEGVHLEDLDDQGLYVFQVNSQPDLVADGKALRIPGVKLDVDPVLQGLKLAGAQE